MTLKNSSATSTNRAYLAAVLRTFAKIPLRGTSDTLGTLYDICLRTQKGRKKLLYDTPLGGFI